MNKRTTLIGGIVAAVVVIAVAVFAFAAMPHSDEQASNDQSAAKNAADDQKKPSDEGAKGDDGQSEEGYVWVATKTTQVYEGGLNIEIAYYYDDDGRLTRSKYASSEEEESEAIGLGQKFSYDAAGRLASVQTMYSDDDALHNAINYKYDDAGRCIEYSEVEDWEGDAGSLTTYTYDEKGLLASAVSKGDSAEVIKGLVDATYEYTYSFTDDKGLTGTLKETGTSLMEEDEEEGFDTPTDATYKIKDGRVVFEEQEVATFKYDDYGNLVEESYDSSDTGTYKILHEYKQVKVKKSAYQPNIYTNPTPRTYERCTQIPPVLSADEVEKILKAATAKPVSASK